MGDVRRRAAWSRSSRGERFLAVRGEGCRADASRSRLSANTDLDRLFWVYGFRGRPARPTVEVLGELIDRSSVGGGDVRPRLGDATT